MNFYWCYSSCDTTIMILPRCIRYVLIRLSHLLYMVSEIGYIWYFLYCLISVIIDYGVCENRAILGKKKVKQVFLLWHAIVATELYCSFAFQCTATSPPLLLPRCLLPLVKGPA